MAGENNIEIRITTPADVSGVVASTAAIKDVGKATGAAATSTQAQAKATNDLGETYEKGAAAGRVLSEVSRGNIFALGQLGAVIKAVGQAFKANPLFLIGSLAATLVLPVIAKIGEGWEAQKKKAEEAGKASADAAGAALKAIETNRQNAAERYFQDIATAATAAKARAEALDLVLVAQIDRQEAVALATVDANNKLSESEKLTAKLAISREARAGRDKVELAKIAREEQTANDQAKQSAAAAATALGKEQSIGRLVDRLGVRTPEKIQAELDLVKKQEAALAEEEGVASPFKSQQWSDLEAELADATANFATRQKDAQAALIKAIDERRAAERAAADAATVAATASATAESRRDLIKIVSGGKTAVEDIALPGLLKGPLKAETEAANLTAAGVEAGRIGAYARNIANGAPGDSGLGAATNAVAAAAKAAHMNGTTRQEVEALVAATQDLARELAARNQESTLLKASVRILTSQLQTDRTRR